MKRTVTIILSTVAAVTVVTVAVWAFQILRGGSAEAGLIRNDPKRPVAIGDSRDKVRERCGRADRSSTSEDVWGVHEFVTFEDFSFMPRDCVGRLTFYNGTLTKIQR